MNRLTWGCIGLLATTPVCATDSSESGKNYPSKATHEASIHRGAIVYNHYCVLCHGVNADGTERAAKLYNPRPANLIMSNKNDQYKELIIRRDDKMLGRSEAMPAWGEELTDEQITDVVAFLGAVRSPKVHVK